MFKKPLLYALAVLFLASCGGSTPTKIKEFDLTVDLPSGWTIGSDTYGDELTVEFTNNGKMRVLQITEAKPKAESLEELVAAAKEVKSIEEVLNKESYESGFGITVKDKGQKEFIYYFNKGDKQYKFERGSYYKEKDFEDCIKIIKSAK